METNKRPKSLNFADAAERCLRHMTSNYDADHDYVPYVGVTLGEKRPHFVHHRLDWSEVIPYAIYGEICARDLCGSQEGTEIEKKQRELFLRQISPLDFLIHSSSSPWNKAYEMCLWEQSRALHALLYWYMEEHTMSDLPISCRRWLQPCLICHIKQEISGPLPRSLFAALAWVRLPWERS